MKSYLKTILLTSAVMLLVLGGTSFLLLRSSQSVQKEQEKLEAQQLDKKIYGMEQEDVSDDDIVPLHLSGEGKNVTTFEYASEKDIYNTKNSKRTREELEKLKKKNSYNMDAPLWAYNPFGTNQLSLYLYFNTADAYRVEYTIHTNDSDMADFNRSCYGSNMAQKEHEYQILGLTPEKENYIILKFYDSKGELKNRKVYSITPPRIKGLNQQMMVVDGTSMEQISQGLYFFLGHDWENKKAPRGIWVYDNSGVLRGAIPTVSGRAMELLELPDGLLYNYSNTGLAKVDRYGQVTAVYNLKSHTLSGGFTYDGYGHIVCLVSKKGAKTRGDRLLTLDLTEGKVGKEISLSAVIKGVSKKQKDWLQADSITMIGSSGVLISSQRLSSLIRIQNIFSENPMVSYVIGPASTWEKSDYTRLSYAEEDATAEPYKPSGLTLKEDARAAEGIFSVVFYNNIKAGKEGTMYEYTINESDGTYYLEDSFGLAKSVRENSVQAYKEHTVVNSSEDCMVTEYDEKGKAILSLKYNIEKYTPKVYKMDMKGFWFQ